jgi:hypothetical protein
LPEHFAHVETVGLSELASRLPGFFAVENALNRIRHVAGVLRSEDIGLRSILVNGGHDLGNFGFNWLFRVLDLFYLLVAFISHVSQSVLEAHHAVVGCPVRSFFGPVFLGYISGVFLTVLKGIAEVLGRKSLLLSERTGLSTMQNI